MCILHYFSRILSDVPPNGIVTFSRRCLNQPPDFVSSDAKFRSIAFGVSSTCLIEDADPETLQVNFANRFLGGGVLRGGCVQEEILCCIRPEILAGLLFIEAMDNHEALIIEGAERFSRYTGYGKTFKWAGDFNEAADAKNTRCFPLKLPRVSSFPVNAKFPVFIAFTMSDRNEDGRWLGAITAIDALHFARRAPQFEGEYIRRELDKAYCGFTNLLSPHRGLPNVVVSGHWGCGVYNGDRELKCLIQMMACAQAGKSLAYCTFSDDDFAKKALQVFQVLCSSSCTVGKPHFHTLKPIEVLEFLFNGCTHCNYLNKFLALLYPFFSLRLMALVVRPIPNFMLVSHTSRSILRHVSVKSWPTLDNPWRERLTVSEQATFPPNYVISREEFRFVELLKPMDTIPPPPAIDLTPSGWRPPRPEVSSKKPYTVTRSRNHMLPVYLEIKERKRREQTHGKRMLTVVTRVGGDISALAAELEALLKDKCEAGRFLCQVDEVTQKIKIDGVFLDEVAAFLIENGF
ncbi:unnamed protein product [Hydatigera taeniaeformis]|uniref:Large ribosomal subunit protein mL49 n=1 Tax=Hydatigena taeniaeformis TaxID=6205 RepID=A0A3P7F722_HYDTA|nr:unnamed protein product [Hydatigera taeniaeformis]